MRTRLALPASVSRRPLVGLADALRQLLREGVVARLIGLADGLDRAVDHAPDRGDELEVVAAAGQALRLAEGTRELTGAQSRHDLLGTLRPLPGGKGQGAGQGQLDVLVGEERRVPLPDDRPRRIDEHGVGNAAHAEVAGEGSLAVVAVGVLDAPVLHELARQREPLLAFLARDGEDGEALRAVCLLQLVQVPDLTSTGASPVGEELDEDRPSEVVRVVPRRRLLETVEVRALGQRVEGTSHPLSGEGRGQEEEERGESSDSTPAASSTRRTAS